MFGVIIHAPSVVVILSAQIVYTVLKLNAKDLKFYLIDSANFEIPRVHD